MFLIIHGWWMKWKEKLKQSAMNQVIREKMLWECCGLVREKVGICGGFVLCRTQRQIIWEYYHLLIQCLWIQCNKLHGISSRRTSQAIGKNKLALGRWGHGARLFGRGQNMKILSEIYMEGGLSKSCEGHDSCKFPTKSAIFWPPAKKSRAVTPPSYPVF